MVENILLHHTLNVAGYIIPIYYRKINNLERLGGAAVVTIPKSH